MDYTHLAASLGIRNSILSGSELRAQCPLHQDNNPSFSLNVDKGVWICFSGCGNGDFLGLVQRILGCSSLEAREWIGNNGRASSADQLFKELNLILDPKQKIEGHNIDWEIQYGMLSNKTMPEWFLKRGFTWDTVNRWGIRYDLLNNSVIIPVYWEEELVGTVTRHTMPGWPKYQYSPGFRKSGVLFGEISNTQNHIIICEGILDALWLWQNGHHAVSILGSAMSKTQCEILRSHRFTEIVLALDNDEAGNIGTLRAIELLTSSGWLLPQLTMMRFPKDKKDAQDCTPEELKEIFEQRKGVYLELTGTA